jgi:hypothetical protein
MKNLHLAVFITFIAIAFTPSLQASTNKKPKGEYYQITIYHFKNTQQLAVTEAYLQSTYLPILHKIGIEKIGVFASIDNDTAVDKKLYVLLPIKRLQQLQTIATALANEAVTTNNTSSYIAAVYDKPPYERMETIVLKSFDKMPFLQTPQLTSPLTERVYELRSYEAATEQLYNKKVNMFNAGGEVALFNRLQFNAVFYAEVLAGSRMPNLMYMTTFNNKAERDDHWKTFVADAEWKTLSALPEYQYTVSKADIFFLRPTSYSDY